MELKKYNQNVKPGMKAKVSATDQFYVSVCIVGSELAPQKQWPHGCFIHQSLSLQISYHMDKFSILGGLSYG